MPALIAAEPSSVSDLQASEGMAWALWLIAVLFVASRLPSMLREPGREDEDVYAVPGWTILHTGVPSTPHLPSRNLKSPYYKADQIAFLEPPLFFYVQAAFFAVLPVEYWSARLPAAVSGALLLVMLGRLALRAGATPSAACWAAGLFALSRWLYFNATHARPDALCTAFGFAALLAVETWTRSRQSRWLVAGGVAIGLGGLTHPFAIVYAIQAAVWAFVSARGRQRLIAPAILALVALAVASTWLLLILQNVSAFEIQFENQFVHTRGGSFFTRLLWPWPAVRYHAIGLFGHVSPWQFLLAAFGSIVCIACGKTENRPLLATIGWLAVSGALLMCALVGTHHPVFGYFAYPSALAFVGVGWAVDRVVRRAFAAGRVGRYSAFVLGAAVVASMLFGSKIRVITEYVRHWNDINFNAPRFAASVIERLPPDATFVVDEEFVLDFLTAGRKTIAFRALVEGALPRTTHYDYRIRSRSTERYFKDLTWDDDLVWTAGDPTDPYGCYVMVFKKSL